jgi:hypothetical protein
LPDPNAENLRGKKEELLGFDIKLGFWPQEKAVN